MKSFKAQILTPEGSLFEGEVTGVRVPGEAGNFEVKTLHADIISTLEVGELLVRKASGEKLHYAVSGGFVEVFDNKLTLLAEAAEPITEIDIERAEKARERAKKRIRSNDPSIDRERAERALKRAENRISLSVDISASMQ